MTLTRVVGKGRVAEMTTGELDELRSAYARCAVDLGTGDAHFVYHLAAERPDWLVIGVDAIDAPMGETAYRAARKPARGGRANLVLVRAAVESMPSELAGVAHEVDVLLPWGALLEGIVLGRPGIVAGIAAVARPGATVTVILNGEIWLDSTPARFEDLPVVTPEYVARVIAPAFEQCGVAVGAARYLDVDEAKGLATTWARRLGHGRAHPRFVLIEGVRSGA